MAVKKALALKTMYKDILKGEDADYSSVCFIYWKRNTLLIKCCIIMITVMRIQKPTEIK